MIGYTIKFARKLEKERSRPHRNSTVERPVLFRVAGIHHFIDPDVSNVLSERLWSSTSPAHLGYLGRLERLEENQMPFANSQNSDNWLFANDSLEW